LLTRLSSLWRKANITPDPRNNEFFITGGIGKNSGVVKRVEKELGAQALQSPYDSQIAGALGAALFAHTLLEKEAK